MDCQNKNIGFEKRTYVAMDDAKLFRTVEAMMRVDKVFLDPNLTMESLADRIGVHRNSLSRAVNRHAGENFASYLDRYRVEEAERLAVRSADGKVNMTELALQAGFSSHTPFYRAVRAIRNSTPSEAFKVASERSNNSLNRRQLNKNKNQD